VTAKTVAQFMKDAAHNNLVPARHYIRQHVHERLVVATTDSRGQRLCQRRWSRALKTPPTMQRYRLGQPLRALTICPSREPRNFTLDLVGTKPEQPGVFA
jgi:hypothetical protein